MYINGTLYFNMAVGSYTDFLAYEDLTMFELVEHSGAAGIEINVAFRTKNENIKNAIVSNNLVTFELGESKSNCYTYKGYPYDISPSNDGSGTQFSVTFSATPFPQFIVAKSLESFTGTSADVIKKITKKYFGKEATINVVPFEDQKTWICNFMTGARYLMDTCLHMYIGDQDAPVMYIDKDGNTFVYSIEVLKSQDATRKFVPTPVTFNPSTTYQYLNDFNVNVYKISVNKSTGSGDITTIKDTSSGKDSIFIPENFPDLASTTEVEKIPTNMVRFSENLYQSDNTHANYQKAYKNNVARMERLASIEGKLIINGFHPEIHPLEIVEIDAKSNRDSGKYIIDTKSTILGYNIPVTTSITVCRDNRNRIEDSLANKSKATLSSALRKIFNQQVANTLQAIRNLRRLIVMVRQLTNGWFLKQVLSYLNTFKYTLLTSFSLFGVTLNFNSTSALFASLKSAGNAFCNQIVNAFIPYPYNYVFQDIVSMKPSMKTLLSKLIYQFAPTNELSGLIQDIIGLFNDLTGSADTLYNICADQYSLQQYSESGYSSGTLTSVNGSEITLPNYKGQDEMESISKQSQIQIITNDFISNTEGTDVPITQIDLTESEMLLPEYELRELMADRVVDDLTTRGYLEGVLNFREILLGEESLDFNTINTIQNNIGQMLYARYWGTIDTIENLTDFYIKNQFKDIYVTVPTTKIISALKGAKVFMALPSTEENLVFYINNIEVEMDKLENIDLGIYDSRGNLIYYTAYISKDVYHSNGVILEVRKKEL